VDVDGLVRAPIRQAPDVGQQVAPGDHLAGVQRQVVQQVELAPAEVQPRPVQGGLVPGRVQPQAADLELASVRRPALGGAAQDRPDPRVDLAGPERLDHIVVGARVQHPDDLCLVVACRDHHHRYRADRAHHPQRLVAAETGQAEVEQDQVGGRVEDVLQRVHRARHAGHGVAAFGESPDEGPPDGGVVLDQQQLCHGHEVTRA
jgi:hypothetical protein